MKTLMGIETGHSAGPGRLITVDGFDGTGKSSICRSLCRSLRKQGRRVVKVRTPTPGFKRSTMFRRLAKEGRVDLVDPLALQVAHMADRLQLVRREVVPALERDEDVVVDRYLAGAFGALVKWGIDDACWFHSLCRTMPTPTLGVYVYVSFDEWTARMSRRVASERTMATKSDFCAVQELGRQIAADSGLFVMDTSGLTVETAARVILQRLERKTSRYTMS